MEKDIKVTKIINENRIVLNAGARDNIILNDLFEIFVTADEIIYDLDTGEELGALKYIKATVRVEYVDEKFCICVNNNSISMKNSNNLFKAIEEYKNSSPTPLPLNVNPEDISGGYEDIINKDICVGDLAKKL